MKAIAFLVAAATMILTLLNAIIFVGTTIDLLQQYVGILAYILWLFALPILSPTVIALPWFEAWVSGSQVSPTIFWIWLLWLICMVARIPFVYLGLDPDV